MRFKSLIAISIFSLSACTGGLVKNTVKITNLAGNSGGTGTVVYTSNSFSEVLTNSHVCGVAAGGGLVHDDDGGQHFIVSYRQSRIHDLCLIRVAADLKTKAIIANRAPALYESATVIGHPKLLPTIISKGHFSSKLVIELITGYRDCALDDFQDPSTGFFCALFGKLPIISTYESIVVSNLIQPGSSGSPVYNSSGELAAVIFAGSGEISYGLAVPYEYVREFLSVEIDGAAVKYPDSSIKSPASSKSKSVRDYTREFRDACENNEAQKTNEICKRLAAIKLNANL